MKVRTNNKKQRKPIIIVGIIAIILLCCVVSLIYYQTPKGKAEATAQAVTKTVLAKTPPPTETQRPTNTVQPTDRPTQKPTPAFRPLPREEVTLFSHFEIKQVYFRMRDECIAKVDDPDTCPREDWDEYAKSLIGRRVRWTGWYLHSNVGWIDAKEVPDNTIEIEMDNPDDKTDDIKGAHVFLISDSNPTQLNKGQELIFEGTISQIGYLFDFDVVLTDVVIVNIK